MRTAPAEHLLWAANICLEFIRIGCLSGESGSRLRLAAIFTIVLFIYLLLCVSDWAVSIAQCCAARLSAVNVGRVIRFEGIMR